MALRRGFTAQAVRLAKEVRAELCLGDCDRFDPYALAEEYGIDRATLRT